MSLLDPLLGVANTSEVLAASTSSGAGGTVTIAAPGLLRKYSGKFQLIASVSATTAGAGTQGIKIQLISSLVGAVGPAITAYGASADGSCSWIDYSGIDVGQAIQYSVQVTPVSGSNTISVAPGAAALTVHEL